MLKNSIKLFMALVMMSLSFSQDTLTVLTYNALRFGENDRSRALHFEKVIRYIDPDIVALQEIEDQGGIDLLLNEVFNKSSQEYSAGPLTNNRDMENGIIYRNSKLDLISSRSIKTVLRDISGFTFSIKNAAQSVVPFTVFSAHLKASTGSSNENQRWEEAKQLQSYINQQSNDYHYILAGDLNLYSPNEQAYKLLVDSMSVDLVDPIGPWVRDDNSHVLKFTQSTRTDQIGDGGSTGGLDDRFDFILFSEQFTSTNPNLKLLDQSYKVVGNDGKHFNRSIIEGTNSDAPNDIIESIYYASDHYPVIAKLVYTTKTSTSPIAHAGQDQSATIGETVFLDGSKSYDPNGSIVAYDWTQVSGPQIPISSPASRSASIVIPNVNMTTIFSFQLKVTDNDGEIGTDQVNITIPITTGFTPYDIQISTDKGIGDDCYPSPFVGQSLEVTGVVTAVRPDDQYPNFFIQDPQKKEWAGIFVYIPSAYNPPEVGTLVELTADIKEYFGLTELANISKTVELSYANTVEPVLIKANALSRGCSYEGEIYEGMLVRIENITVATGLNDKDQFSVKDSIDNEVIVDPYLYKGDWPKSKVGTIFDSITGVVHYSYNEFKILPISKDDFVLSDSSVSKPKERNVLIFPNPSKSKVNFKFNTNSLGKIEADIININGGLVLHLFNGVMLADNLYWNGKDLNGREAPAGIYFLRLKADNNDSAHKFVLLR